MTERRRMLKKVEPVVLEAEIIDAPQKIQTETWELQNQRKHEVIMKSLDSLPDAIGIAKDLVGIWRLKEETNRDIQLIDKEIDKLQAQTEDFVKREIAKRDSANSRAQQVQVMLRDFYVGLNQMDASDEIKKRLIDTFDLAVKTALEEQ